MKLTAKILSVILLTSASAALIAADSPPNPAKQAIKVRKSVYTLIGHSFKPLGDVSKGTAEYKPAEVEKSAKQIVMLSEFLDTAFPEESNVGEPDTKAKPEIWKQRADFDKRLKDFQTHAAALAVVAAKEKTASDAFKEAVGALGKDCKGCHENFKLK